MMQKLIYLLLLNLIASLSLSAQSFDIITINKAANVYLYKSNESRVEYFDGSKKVSATGSTQSSNKLIINESNSIDVHIYTANIASIVNNNSAYITSADQFFPASLSIEQNAAGYIQLNVVSSSISITNNGIGEINISGNAESLIVTNNGSGNIITKNLKAKDIVATINNMGNIEINPLGKIIVNKNGSGDVIVDNMTANTHSIKEEIIEKEVIIENTPKDGNGNNSIDTIKFKLGKKRILYIEDKNEDIDKAINKKPLISKAPKVDWAGIEWGLYNWVDKDLKIVSQDYFQEKNALKSNILNINFLELHTKGKQARIVTGAGLNFTYFRFSRHHPITDADVFTLVADTANQLRKIKLVSSSIAVPLMVQLNSTKQNKTAIRVSTGVIGYYRFANALKMKTPGDRSIKSITRDDFNMRKVRYDATIRLGYRHIFLFANYGMQSLFEDKQGTDIRPLTLGINVLGF